MDQSKKTMRHFYCRDVLWETFEQMANDFDCSIDYLINEAMRFYARSKNYQAGSASSQNLPQAVALGTISYNIARSFGPALGGLIVLAFGAKAAFAINATFYIPLWLAFFVWARLHMPSRLPPERIDRAILAGARYALHSPPVRVVLIRAFAFGLTTIALVWLAFVVTNNWETLPTILGLFVFGVGQGALVTLVFNVLVTASPKTLAGDVGSVRGTTQNLASAVGTAVAGALLVGILSFNVVSSLADHPELSPELVSQIDLDSVNFVSNDRAIDAAVFSDLFDGCRQSTEDNLCTELLITFKLLGQLLHHFGAA